ncbi:MAG: tetratricopeptide repeat protein [Defluviitaleaceae bacterium]|nr:tetratricopeptide repeat protein [Defluviitaleaceae bacterium]
MYCPNCGAENIKGYICRYCGVDIVVFSKAANVSNLLYNKGLAHAKERNFSAAISALEKSIKFKKEHYIARNLLGLLYYETGQIGEALKQWIISYNMVKTDNLALYYMQKVQGNPRDTQAKSEAVQIYNKGLAYLDNKNNASAIVHLRKSLEINPKFLLAANLLTFCLLINGNKEEALQLIAHTLKIDRSNKTAVRYHIAITGRPPKKTEGKGKKSNKYSRQAPPTQSYKSVVEQAVGFGSISFSHIVSFVIGSGVVFGMLFFFIMPAWVGDMETQIEQLNAEISNMQQIHQELQYQSAQEIEELEAANQDMEMQIATLQEQIFAIDQEYIIAQVQNIIATDPVGAAELLDDININLVEPQNVAVVQSLMTTAYSGAAQSLFNSGVQNYSQGDFTIATGFFERSLRFSELSQDITGSPSPLIANGIYYLGRIAYAQGNNHLAITLLYSVINDHPASGIVASAMAFLQAAQTSLELQG